MSIQKQFAEQAVSILINDIQVTAIAAGGSWLTGMDRFSDLDLILVTKNKVSGKDEMHEYANRLGTLLSGFTGDHVGETRLLICLYDNPLLHVDIKFLTIPEVAERIETPWILFDRDGSFQKVLTGSNAVFPYPDRQWIEDRFWVWIHYALLKIGRGELLEAFDFLGFLRQTVLGPMLHIKNQNLPKGVRHIETSISEGDIRSIQDTIPQYNRESLLQSLESAVRLYQSLREDLYWKNDTLFKKEAEEKVILYLREIRFLVAGPR